MWGGSTQCSHSRLNEVSTRDVPGNNRKLSLLFVILISWLGPSSAFSQTESFGTIKYTPPAGWNKTQTQPNVIAFSIQDKTTGGFCIITLHGARTGSGNAQNDFTKEWNSLVVQPFKAEAKPKTETKSEDGWTATAGGAAWSPGTAGARFLTVLVLWKNLSPGVLRSDMFAQLRRW